MGNACKKYDETAGNITSYTREEVASHNQPNDCWIIIDNQIYNVSEYWKVHPGGGSFILKYGGKDATLAFREFNHSPFAMMQLKSLNALVGTLNDDGSKNQNAQVPEKYFLPMPINEQRAMEQKLAKDIEESELLGSSTSNIAQDLMFCFQCQQNVKNTGCNTIGVCGKSPTAAALQDLIIHYAKGVCQYALAHPSLESSWNDDLYITFAETVFSTLTNVNFDRNRHIADLEHLSKLRDALKQKYEAVVPANERDQFLSNGASPSTFVFKKDLKYLLEESRKVGLLERKKNIGDPNLFGLIEMAVYGIKGGCSYFYHAEQLRREKPDLYTDDDRKVVYRHYFQVMAGLATPNPTLDYLVGLNMKVGEANLFGMTYLDKGHTEVFGRPVPTDVPRSPIPGKCILVSGHDQLVLRKLLEQTEGTGINVYTHGEMLNAFGYPTLRKFKHLAANFGTAWYNQSIEFADFPGPILMNSNCLIQPRDSYKHRLFTTHAVGWGGISHIVDENYQKIIECAKKEAGFEPNTPRFQKYSNIPTEKCGYGHATLCELLVPEIQKGNLKEIYLVGGCDNLDPERDFYKQIALSLPDTSVVLTLGCGKFRLMGIRDRMGNIKNTQIPRLLDVGQCNDSYSAVKTALALAELLKVGVNDLPLHLVLSWVEQKAVVILLTLLHLGIKNIVIGPSLPAFLTPALLDFLVKNFQVQTTGANKLYSAKRDVDLVQPSIQQQFVEGEAIKEFETVRQFRLYKLAKKTKVSSEVTQYTFEFNNKNSVFSLLPGRHILIRAQSTVDMNYVSRAYTPITKIGTKGKFDILVKSYPNGLMCRYLENLAEGSVLEIQGYCGSTVYSAPGQLISEERKFNAKKINMIGGGVSFVSMFQILQSVVDNANDNTQLAILGAFSKQAQVLLKNESQELAQKKQQNVKLQIITSETDGRINQNIIKNLLFPESNDTVTILGGPASFRAAALDILKGLGYKNENIVLFY